ncbi:MAG TPA: PDZ domain-containing protein [Tepidisphaeraceae bacterium]|nr:PDZ domain-containing protein [Tepidisphaeraceae bacterium]
MLRHYFASTLIVAGVASAALAQERPNPAPREPNAIEPQRQFQRAHAAFAAQQPMEMRAWMGVSVTPATPAMAHQLKLPEGTGLVVEFTEPRSPAAEAGLKPYDLLLKIDDQLLVNAEQFAVLVRMHKAGDEVKFSILREGQPQTVTVKLIEHEVPRLGELEGLQFWTEPQAPRGGFGGFAPPMGMRPNPGANAQKSITWFDGKRQITVNTEAGKSVLVVTDPESGRVIMKAPVDTEQERQSLPEDIRDVLKQLPLGTGPDRDNPPAPQSLPPTAPKPRDP